MITRRSSLALTTALGFAASSTHGANEPPQTTHDGLVLQPNTKLRLVYLKPDADFSVYDSVALLDCAVAFKKNWQREQNSANPLAITKSDMDKIRNKLSEMFSEVFKDELTKDGKFKLSDVAAPDVLILRPAIVDLDIAAPDAAELGRSRTFATSAGQMTLYMEAFDSTTSEILARVADREAGRDMGRMMWQNAATNRADAERILRKWAQTLRTGLETLQAKEDRV